MHIQLNRVVTLKCRFGRKPRWIPHSIFSKYAQGALCG
jgi:hypothetical protein